MSPVCLGWTSSGVARLASRSRGLTSFGHRRHPPVIAEFLFPSSIETEDRAVSGIRHDRRFAEGDASKETVRNVRICA